MAGKTKKAQSKKSPSVKKKTQKAPAKAKPKKASAKSKPKKAASKKAVKKSTAKSKNLPSSKDPAWVSSMDLRKFKDEVWPQERDFMARPERFKYVRKLARPTGCVFCAANKRGPGLESLVLYQNKWAMTVINKYPYNSGHLLVIPNNHIGNLEELKDEEYLELSKLLRDSVDIIKRAYNCEGVNLGMNLGAVAGAGIPDHLHWHIVPRWFGDSNFFPLIAETKALPESIDQVYNRLKPFFEELG